MNKPVAVSDLANMLAERIDALVCDLLPNGRAEGGEYRVGSVAGEAGRSLAVRLTGARQGVWCDFGGGPDMRGDALDLVAQVLFRGNKADAIQWARGWLNIDDTDYTKMQTYRRQAEQRAKSAAREEELKRGAAMKLWLECPPGLAGTAADRYLLGRGIDIKAIGREPRALRFHPALWNEESQRHWPAMLAAVVRDSYMVGVHRTWLEEHGDGRVTKAPLEKAKMALGRYAGGAIRLWRGGTAKAWANVQPGEWIVLSEGIEDGMSAVMVRPDYRTWAALSLSNIGGIQWPAEIEGVIVLAQNDVEPQAIGDLSRAVESIQRQGKRVKIARPPADVKDANDLLRKEKGEPPYVSNG